MNTWAFDRFVPSAGVWTFDRLVDVIGTPTITSVGTVRDGSPITITGTAFSASGNSVFLIQGDITLQLPINTEGATSIVTTALDTSGLYLTQPIAIYVTNNAAVESNAVAATILPASGKSATAITQSFLGNSSTRASSSPDLGFTDEVRIQNVVGGTISDVSMTGQGAFAVTSGVTAFDYAVQDGTGLGGFQTVLWADPLSTLNPPNIINLSQGEAFATLQAVGLVPILVTPQQSATIALAKVAAQFPDSTALVAIGSTVEITMSLGLTGTIVPVLTGLTKVQSEALRLAAGLTGATFRVIDGNNSGIVTIQSVAPGELRNIGDAVDIAYSSNLAPSVRRLTAIDAQALLAAANLTYAKSVTVFDASTAAGKVSAQLPAAESVVSAGDTITVNLSLGAALSALGLSGPGVSSSGVSGPGISIGTTSNPIGTTADSTLVTADSTLITADQT